MAQRNQKSAEIYARITDTVFAVIMGLSFKEYHWLLAPPVPSLQLAMIIFAYLVVVMSRVGYHKSVSSKPYKGPKRFLVDLWILYMYFVLTFAPKGKGSTPNILIIVYAQVGVFAGYLAWDWIKKREYPNSPTSRIHITTFCLFVTVIMLIIFYQPFLLTEERFLGGFLRDWLFLEYEYIIMVLFWALKLR